MSYRIHVPRGGGLARLPEDYETIDEATLAFELDPGDVPWCFIGRHEPGQDLFVLRGVVQASRVTWRPVS